MSRVHALTTYLLAALFALVLTGPAHAGLDDAWNSLSGGTTSTGSGPQMLQSASRAAVVGGGADIRFGRERMTHVFSVTPPTLSAGCSGIDAHFGGFSFINGEAIKMMVQRIAQNAVGTVVSLSIKVLCPMCSSVIESMQNLAAQAARHSIDSCKMAKNLIDMGSKAMTGDSTGDLIKENCSAYSAADGTGGDDWLASLKGACRNVNQAIGKFASLVDDAAGALNPDGTPKTLAQIEAQKKELATKGMYGNNTWMVLGTMGLNDLNNQDQVWRRTLMMNLMGTAVVRRPVESSADTTGTATNGSATTVDRGCATAAMNPGASAAEYVPTCYVPPKLTGRDVFDVFLCGAYPGKDGSESEARGILKSSPALLSHCAPVWVNLKKRLDAEGGVMTVFVCSKVGNDNYLNLVEASERDCLNPRLVPLADFMSSLGPGKGFLFHVNELLMHGVNKVRTDTPFFRSGASDYEQDRALFTLIEAAPYPLYQAINAAAVYPAAGGRLVDSMSILVGQLAATQYFSDLLANVRQEGVATFIPKDSINRVLEAMEMLEDDTGKRRAVIAQNMALQEGLIASIRQINLAIQRQVMTEELLGNAAYSTQVMQAVGSKASGSKTSSSSTP